MPSSQSHSPRRGRPMPSNSKRASERSPLLLPTSDDDEGSTDGNTILADQEDLQQTKSTWYLILLTISIGGLQIAWSVELSNGSPYLLSLGLSKSLMALVWIAGPLTGTLVQPYVGMKSDNCRLPWGKRKPFMLGGAVATIISLMFLAWTREIVTGILGLFGADIESRAVRNTIICVAVVGIYVLDFAINTVQASIRAFIVDCAPAHQQEAANAMASRITGFGNILGYVAGYINLPTYLWFLGDTQFKVLCAIASIALATTIVVSTTLIKERDPRLEGPPVLGKPGVFSFFTQIFASIKRLPPQIRKVCQVQLCAWVGFFPLLFYTSSYIGEIYVEPYLEANPHMTPEELDRLYERATRIGTFALLINSVVSLLTNVFLPFFVAPTYDSQPIDDLQGDSDSADYDNEKSSWLDKLQIPGFTLKRAWFASLLLFSGAMFCTVIVRTVEAATALIGLVGITWAMTLWAPWAIISAEISRRDAMIRQAKQRQFGPSGDAEGPASPSLDSVADSELNDGEEPDQAGVILGIHNMAIAAPQIIATVGSSVIFRVWQKPRGTPGDHSIAIVLAFGGIAVLVSSFFVASIKESAAMPADAMIVAEEGEGEGAAGSRPGTARSRNKSYEHLPRASIKRATITRNKSFGGAEY
ncbi:general alpha-glucoside permease [Colletotrichum graminicola]|uniref:General alpha-glucoside permease n=1 Tax=Colletotrichum graminicola (strain M1.001 / M2 / FGSC 10212) TaxID=645133 RepID=E3Q312_COLGM|nr:general alpha-glucoside permease [Colletotrichum graminicola M1.001]EFQ24991.1 general alpha-glucoside permease [Colletotrichum graminicola M1.001]WDK15439.1 general alpha-glucoside permease [Colletotrichum graminicola]